MILLKILGLTALAALMAMAFVGASSAMAESTALCSGDESPCAAGSIITHVHETSVGTANLLSSFLNVECDVLFLGDTVKGTEAPLEIKGNFTYSNCTNKCVVTEENGPSEEVVLRFETETATIVQELLIHVVCSGFVNCRYIGLGLSGVARGALSSPVENGDVRVIASFFKEGGSLCPTEPTLSIMTTPLIPTYISS